MTSTKRLRRVEVVLPGARRLDPHDDLIDVGRQMSGRTWRFASILIGDSRTASGGGGESVMDRYLVISADGHAGPPSSVYRNYQIRKVDEKWIGGHYTRKFGDTFRQDLLMRPSERRDRNCCFVTLGLAPAARSRAAIRAYSDSPRRGLRDRSRGRRSVGRPHRTDADEVHGDPASNECPRTSEPQEPDHVDQRARPPDLHRLPHARDPQSLVDRNRRPIVRSPRAEPRFPFPSRTVGSSSPRLVTSTLGRCGPSRSSARTSCCSGATTARHTWSTPTARTSAPTWPSAAGSRAAAFAACFTVGDTTAIPASATRSPTATWIASRARLESARIRASSATG